MGRPLGQHFLFQRSILDRIAAAACPEREPHCIEIGPGPGGLTAALRERCDRLTVIELDAALAAALRERYAGDSGVEVVESNVLAVDLTRYGRAVVCGNLPYYITSPIVAKALEGGAALVRGVFLMQKEVADRIAAGPGSRDYGYLSVAVQARARVEKLFGVKPNAFKPPPKVDSAVIRLTPEVRAEPAEIQKFLKFAAACFRQKRKTLKNNLAGSYPAETLAGLKQAGLRAEQIGVDELMAIHRDLSGTGTPAPILKI